ncbi:MAG: aminotransferase class I/II-fold pyridoxal phosphate-dependent enzyme, partial [Anaerolineales bacterium]|nr:aminotransferase class I/II-fold pyridoxal phosphate-dependent enzyme [Anaerolineales bacterium]
MRSHIAALEPYTPILPFEVLSERLGRRPDEIIKLDANENPYGPAPGVRAALADLPFPHIYPDPENRELRAALADYTGMPSETIFAGAGADELIDLIMRLFLDPGDKIIDCPPTFGMYTFDASINAAETISVWRRADFSLDVAAIEAAASQHAPKLLFLASPNNPDGSLLPDEGLLRLLELPLTVVLDEAYIEFAGREHSRLELALQHPNLIVLHTFSKWAGLAGLRIGLGVMNPDLARAMMSMKPPYNVNLAAEVALLASLQDRPGLLGRVRSIVAERDREMGLLQEIKGLRAWPSQANF